MTNILLIVGVGALAVSVVAGVILVPGAALTAWTYAKSPRAQMTKKSLDTRMKGEWYG